MTARTRILESVKKVCQLASDKFGVDLNDIEINIRNCGKAAGRAGCRRCLDRVRDLQLVLNTQLVNEQDAYKLIEEVIPHEIAHLVCFLRPELGNNHDRGWKRVCIMLGGSGERCHKYDLQKARRTRKAIYNINGVPIDIGLTVHRRIQAGTRYGIPCRQTGRRTTIRREDFTGRVVLK